MFEKKSLFLIIVGIFFLVFSFYVFQPVQKSEAACSVGCKLKDGGCYFDVGTQISEHKVCIMGSGIFEKDFWTWDTSCTGAFGACKQDACPTGWYDGTSCSVLTNKGGSCDAAGNYIEASGKWEASSNSCVQCIGAEKVHKIGDTTSLTYVDISDVFSTACGADTACQEKTSGGSCITGKACESRSNTCQAGDTCNSSGRCAAAGYTLNVSRAGTGSGTITSVPAGINCGLDCSENYTVGTSVVLTAIPVSGSTFAGWSGDCSGTGNCNLTMNANKSVIATFALIGGDWIRYSASGVFRVYNCSTSADNLSSSYNNTSGGSCSAPNKWQNCGDGNPPSGPYSCFVGFSADCSDSTKRCSEAYYAADCECVANATECAVGTCGGTGGNQWCNAGAWEDCLGGRVCLPATGACGFPGAIQISNCNSCDPVPLGVCENRKAQGLIWVAAPDCATDADIGQICSSDAAACQIELTDGTTCSCATGGGDDGGGGGDDDGVVTSACDNKIWFFCNPLRGTIEDIFQAGETLIGYILGLIGSIALLLIIIAGVMYMTSMGNEEKITNSKKIVTGAVIGLAIALLSYSLLQLVLSIL